MPAVVSDSSPLVYLTRLGRLPLLRDIYRQVFIPAAVQHEVTVAGAGLPEGREVQAAIADGWLLVATPKAAPLAGALSALGEGEREAILLALERRAMLIIDEADGRSAAERLGVRCTGTIGVLVEAKLRQLIPALKPDLDHLRSTTNFRMTDLVYRRALKAAAE